MKALNVQKISRKELFRHWHDAGLVAMAFGNQTAMYIRSDSKGNVNWDKAPIYTWNEILKEQTKRAVHFTVDPEVFELP